MLSVRLSASCRGSSVPAAGGSGYEGGACGARQGQQEAMSTGMTVEAVELGLAGMTVLPPAARCFEALLVLHTGLDTHPCLALCDCSMPTSRLLICHDVSQAVSQQVQERCALQRPDFATVAHLPSPALDAAHCRREPLPVPHVRVAMHAVSVLVCIYSLPPSHPSSLLRTSLVPMSL